MPFFVAVQYQARPDRVDDLPALIRHDLAASVSAYPARRFARVFQHVQEPARLLGIEEWQREDDFDRHAEAPAYAEVLAACTMPPRASALERLQHYRHMPHQPTALACATITAVPERADDVERFICDEQRRDALIADGLVLRAVYRLDGVAGRLLVLHGWRTRQNLLAYDATGERTLVKPFAQTGTTVDLFSGEIVAQYSWLDA
jgi:quinol monooxygenase YgiN